MPAAEIEALVVAALRNHLPANGTDTPSVPVTDRQLVERHVERVTLSPKHIKLHLRQLPGRVRRSRTMQTRSAGRVPEGDRDPLDRPDAGRHKGIIHVPAAQHTHEAVTARRPADRDRHGASMG